MGTRLGHRSCATVHDKWTLRSKVKHDEAGMIERKEVTSKACSIQRFALRKHHGLSGKRAVHMHSKYREQVQRNSYTRVRVPYREIIVGDDTHRQCDGDEQRDGLGDHGRLHTHTHRNHTHGRTRACPRRGVTHLDHDFPDGRLLSLLEQRRPFEFRYPPILHAVLELDGRLDRDLVRDALLRHDAEEGDEETGDRTSLKGKEMKQEERKGTGRGERLREWEGLMVGWLPRPHEHRHEHAAYATINTLVLSVL